MAAVMALLCLSPRLGQANDAESIVLAEPTLTVSSDGAWMAQSSVQVRLSPVLAEAVVRGVPLYFVSEFELRKTRWWWFDKTVFSRTKTVRLSYHAVTQQYRVAVGGLHQIAYESLEEALSAAVGMRGWRVKESSESVDSETDRLDFRADNLEPRLRVRLDSAQLPKPLQVNAITNRDWNLSSDWVAPRVLMATIGATSR
jgi:hypothetical protein